MTGPDQVLIAILAAGASRRMGRPKQLIRRDGRTLLAHAIEAARGSGIGPVAVVEGACPLAGEIPNRDVRLLSNVEWQQGMAGSIRVAVGAAGNAAALLLMLCDQPNVTAELLRHLYEGWKSGRGIAACTYAGTVGAPAIFDRRFFPKLLELRGDQGAKSIILAHRLQTVFIAAEAAGADVDEEDDLHP